MLQMEAAYYLTSSMWNAGGNSKVKGPADYSLVLVPALPILLSAMAAQWLTGSQYSCELASKGTDLDDGRPPLSIFVCMWVQVLLFVAVMLCFRQWINMWGPFALLMGTSLDLRHCRLVLESPIRSGYLPPNGSNRDWDRLVFSQKLNLTRLNRYKPVIVG